MKILSAMLLCVLAPTMAAAQPATSVSPDSFTADPLFRRYVGDYFQMSHAIQGSMIDGMVASFPAPIKAAVPALPACVNEMRKALSDDVFMTPLMTKLQSLSPEERQQFAGFAQFLHSADGARLIALNHQAMAVSDKPGDKGLPQFTSDHDSAMEQIKQLLQSRPQPNQLPQALFGLGIYLGGIMDDPAVQARLEQAQKDVLATPSCTAMQSQMEAYDKAHPQAQK